MSQMAFRDAYRGAFTLLELAGCEMMSIELCEAILFGFLDVGSWLVLQPHLVLRGLLSLTCMLPEWLCQ